MTMAGKLKGGGLSRASGATRLRDSKRGKVGTRSDPRGRVALRELRVSRNIKSDVFVTVVV